MHTLTLIIILAYAPSLAILWYFYHKDKYEPEPKTYVILTFIYGALNSVIIALFFEQLLFQFIPRTIFTIALISGFVEEITKGYIIRIPYKARQMDGIMDGVVYGVAAGLGFAATENLLYGMGFGIGISLQRALLTPIAHGVWTATVGVGYGLKAENKLKYPLMYFYFAAISLHFLWNYFALLSRDNPFFFSVVILLILFNIAIISNFVKAGLKEDRYRYRESKSATND
ncbi:MAG: PrsW family intramembrane metalloprotease [Methanohalobium sp.]|uniref:PrsW family intramembrane metalloprotease n=1 Tax=Methanohalobium sp. TaxID=2837493 RepID=UPI00397B5A50